MSVEQALGSHSVKRGQWLWRGCGELYSFVYWPSIGHAPFRYDKPHSKSQVNNHWLSRLGRALHLQKTRLLRPSDCLDCIHLKFALSLQNVANLRLQHISLEYLFVAESFGEPLTLDEL